MKQLFAADIFAAWSFGSGVFAGIGVEVSPAEADRDELIVMIELDLADFDNVETVAVHDTSADTSDDAVTALRRRATAAQVQFSAVAMEPDDLVWHLQSSTLDFDPVPGDCITDADSVSWTILAVEKATLGTRWRCHTRREK